MALKFFNLYLMLFLVSCSFSFDKEIINHGSNLKSLNEMNIIIGKTSKSFIVKSFGPPSFINPYNKKNVFYVSQEMKREIGKVNQFEELDYLEIFYDNNDIVKNFYYKKENLPNDINLSKLDEDSTAENRKAFEFFRNIFTNLRRK